jgi:hypothetical protein
MTGKALNYKVLSFKNLLDYNPVGCNSKLFNFLPHRNIYFTNFERRFTLFEKTIAMLTQEWAIHLFFSMFLCGLIFINYTQRVRI